MRTTIELPDLLLNGAKRSAFEKGISLRQFFIEAVEQKLMPEKQKIRRDPPSIGNIDAPSLAALTREQIDEAMLG